MAELIFTISGLRGIVGETLFLETVEQFAAAYARFSGQGVFAIGRDARPTSESFARAARLGLKKTGCEVIELGLCPTPTVVHFVRNRGLRGGLMITASHNPEQWNGMKFVHPSGRFLLPDEFALFQKEVELSSKRLSDPIGGGQSEEADGVTSHITGILMSSIFREVEWVGQHIGVDAVNGAASFAGPKLFQSLGCRVEEIYCSPAEQKGFPRAPEPKAENLQALSRLVQEEGLDAGFAFDPDGDRFSCVDETGVPLGEEATLGLAALFVLERRRGLVVVNLSTSRIIEDICRRFGIKIERTRVGEAFVVKRILETGAVLGGEGNGGVILPEVNLTRDGLVAGALVVALLATTGKKLSELRQELPQYQMAKSTVLGVEFRAEELVAQLKKRLGPDEVDKTEGLRLLGPDWWVHIRKSNTEPIIRIVAEAKTRLEVEEIIQTVTQVVAQM
ncbi:MAG: phosphoglucosamine mutase [bacterium]